jgi:hypothetical protein
MSRSKVLGFLFALLLGFPAYAQMTTTGAGKLPVIVAAYVGPGDIVGSAKAWWGLRAYSAAQTDGTHKAINVIRASDSQTCDVFINTSGGLGNTTACSGAANGTAIATFCNATTCKVVTRYDQTGNGNDLTQATGAKQAVLTFSCRGSLPCEAYAAGQNYGATFSTTNNPFTLSAVAIRTGAFTSEGDMFIQSGAGFYFDTSSNTVSYFNGGAISVTASDNAWHAMELSVDGTASAFIIDGGTPVTTANSFNMTGTLVVGDKSSTPTNGLTGNVGEMGIWPIKFTGTQATNICHNQFVYWGTSTSC